MAITNKQLDILEKAYSLGWSKGPCAYLPDRNWNLLYLDGFGNSANLPYGEMLDFGFRRNGHYLYRPDCSGCESCLVIRLDVKQFTPTRGQKRIFRKGCERFRWELKDPSFSNQKLELLRRYGIWKHEEVMCDTPSHYESFFVESCLGNQTKELSLFVGDRLIGVATFDLLDDVLSAVYTYYDPEEANFSPGIFAILWEIDYARHLGLRYFYPGLYIEESSAMSYKRNFGPNEILNPKANNLF